MTEIDYAKLLPAQPPEGIVDWLFQQNALGGEYLIYKVGTVYAPLEERNVRAIECYCTACGNTYYQEYIKPKCDCGHRYSAIGFIHPETGEMITSGTEIFCPECGAAVRGLHVSNIGTHQGGSHIAAAYPLTVHNIDGNLALLCWCIERRITRGGRELIWINQYEGYLFTPKQKLRFTGRQRGCYSWHFLHEWKPLKRFEDKVGVFKSNMIYPRNPEILNGTPMENSKLDKYIACADEIYPVSYMSLYHRFPNVENLIMSGMGNFLNYKIEDTKTYNNSFPKTGNIRGIKFKKVKPAEMLGLTKAEIRYIKEQQWEFEIIDFYIQSKNQGITLENANKIFNKYGSYTLKSLIGTEANIPRALRYIDKQQKKFKRNHYIDARYLADYWNMAKKNGDDLSDDNFRYPHNLIRAHDNAVKLQEIKITAKRNAKFDKRYKELEKFCFEADGLSIHPARSEQEMITEGKLLHHCVGSYTNRHANGETTIFFIRHTDNPDAPYFTLEFDFENMKVQQNRGLRNCERTEEVIEFEKAWVDYVKGILGNNNKAKNERSAA